MRFASVVSVLTLFLSVPNAFAEPPFAEISALLKQNQLREARTLIDTCLVTAGNDWEMAFRLESMRVESYILGTYFPSAVNSYLDATKYFKHMAKDKRDYHSPELQRFRNAISDLAVARCLEVVGFISRDEIFGDMDSIFNQTNRVFKNAGDIVDDRAHFARHVMNARCQLEIGDADNVIRILNKSIKTIPDLYRNDQSSPSTDTNLDKCVRVGYSSLVLAYIRKNDAAAANTVAKEYLTMVNPTYRPTFESWYQKEIASQNETNASKHIFEPIWDRACKAINHNEDEAFKSLMDTASKQYVSLPEKIKRVKYSIANMRLIEIKMDKTETRALMKVFILTEDYVGIQHIYEPPSSSRLLAEPELAAVYDIYDHGTPMVASVYRPVNVLFHFDGTAWKIERMDLP